MKKSTWYIIIGVVVLIGIGFATKNRESSSLKVEVGKVELRTIVETVSASGKIQPEVEVKLSPEVSGEIIALPVEEGQYVEEGDLLVSINPDLYTAAVRRSEAALNSARAGLSQAEAQLVEAQKVYQRSQTLFNQNVISQQEWDAAQRAFRVSELAVESGEYQVESARATLREAQDNLKRTTIVAPVSGTISALNVELGERVVGTAQMAGTELMRIANLNNMEVLVEVNENDIVKVGLNDTAVIEVDAYLGQKFTGVVTEIANSAKIEGMSADQVTNFEVKVRILNSSSEDVGSQPFRPGMTASVDIRTNRRENVVTVPIEAVTVRDDTVKVSARERIERAEQERDEDKDPYEVVFAEENGKAKLIVVKTGIQDENYIEVLSGLSEGQVIIRGPYNVVKNDLEPDEEVEVESEDNDDE
ncbi:MAG: efflux RND transporter periplasmic adaptor subunit [Flavobacteriia bacterium]|nr:efflux RND transporter periplasmic adaptor subunit [Flavobacteriia bacterium]